MSPALPPLDDSTVERLLRRRADGSADLSADLEPVARFLSAVADLGDAPVVARGALADLLADGFSPAHVPAPATPVPHPVRGRLRALRGPVARLAGLSIVAQVLTGTGVAVASVTAAAGAGVLPASIQEPVGQVLNVVTPFRFPTVPTVSADTEDEPAAPAEGPAPEQPLPAQDTSTGSATTVEPAPEATTAPTTAATPVETPSASAQPSPSPSTTPTAVPSEPASPAPTETASPVPSGTPSVEPTASPTPTAEPSAETSGRPTRQNDPGKKDDTAPTAEPTVLDPALVAVD